MLFVTLTGLLLASFFAEAKTVTCDLKIQTTDDRLVLMQVTTQVIEESSLRYKINIKDDVKDIKNLDTTINYNSLLIGKENCATRQPAAITTRIARYSTITRWSFLDVECSNGRNVTVKLETELLKKMKLSEVSKETEKECRK